MHYMINNFDKALELINKVINELNPLNGKCEYIKALIFIKMQDPIGACPLLKTSLRSGFTASESLYNQYCNFSITIKKAKKLFYLQINIILSTFWYLIKV